MEFHEHAIIVALIGLSATTAFLAKDLIVKIIQTSFPENENMYLFITIIVLILVQTYILYVIPPHLHPNQMKPH